MTNQKGNKIVEYLKSRSVIVNTVLAVIHAVIIKSIFNVEGVTTVYFLIATIISFVVNLYSAFVIDTNWKRNWLKRRLNYIMAGLTIAFAVAFVSHFLLTQPRIFEYRTTVTTAYFVKGNSLSKEGELLTHGIPPLTPAQVLNQVLEAKESDNARLWEPVSYERNKMIIGMSHVLAVVLFTLTVTLFAEINKMQTEVAKHNVPLPPKDDNGQDKTQSINSGRDTIIINTGGSSGPISVDTGSRNKS